MIEELKKSREADAKAEALKEAERIRKEAEDAALKKAERVRMEMASKESQANASSSSRLWLTGIQRLPQNSMPDWIPLIHWMGQSWIPM